MQPKGFSRAIAGRMAGLLLVAALAAAAHAQFYGGAYTGNKKDKPIDVSSYPANIQQEYKTFKYTCSECHTLDRSLRGTQTPAVAEHWVKVMQAIPAADFNDRQAKQIIDFINYYQSHLPKDEW
jgi:mono/diheme cytochrome c family protein